MNIRTIASADTWDVAASYVRAFYQVDPSERWTTQRAQELVSFFVEQQPDLAFMAQVDGRCAGAIMGMVKPWWDGPCLIDTEIFVDPSYAKQGIGVSLGRHYLHAAVAKYNVRTIQAITFKNLEFPAALLAKVGFVDKQDWKVVVADAHHLLQMLERNAPRR
jgi:GNAT superfamily N-acetyltransferase